MLYHASQQRFDRPSGRFCLTDDPHAALGYLHGGSGYLYSVELIREPYTADEATVRRLARRIGIDYGGYAWEAIEGSERLREALRKAGYEAVEYWDLGPDNAYEHWALMLLDPSLARITSVKVVTAEEITA